MLPSPPKTKERLPGAYTVSQCPGDAAVAVTSTKSMLTLTVHMTSPIMRTEEGGGAGVFRGVGGASGVCVSQPADAVPLH